MLLQASTMMPQMPKRPEVWVANLFIMLLIVLDYCFTKVTVLLRLNKILAISSAVLFMIGQIAAATYATIYREPYETIKITELVGLEGLFISVWCTVIPCLIYLLLKFSYKEKSNWECLRTKELLLRKMELMEYRLLDEEKKKQLHIIMQKVEETPYSRILPSDLAVEKKLDGLLGSFEEWPKDKVEEVIQKIESYVEGHEEEEQLVNFLKCW